MRQSVAAIALIRDQDLWLAQWNDGWQAYNFVGGHKHDDESFRECVIREIDEELQLTEPNVQVADQPLARVDYIAWSQRANEDTRYIMEVFAVQLGGPHARQIVDNEPNNRWLSESEIKTQRCVDGRPVSETMNLLLSKSGLPSSRFKPVRF